METGKRLGIWMDHSSAHLMEYNEDSITTNIISSDFTFEEKEETLSRSENTMHNKEQHKQAAYYKKIGEVIKNYDEVIIFGPTDAKAELYNSLKRDHHFDKIKIDVKDADKMTTHQQEAYVREYFANKLIFKDVSDKRR
jgi:stalled ribosome rescue protein Dom34